MTIKRAIISIPCVFCLLINYGKAQSKKDISGVINFISDSLLLKNKDQILRVGSLSHPYLLKSTTVKPRLGSDYFGFLNVTVLAYSHKKDTAGLAQQVNLLPPIDLNTVMTCKKNLILSNYLPEDSVFKERIEGVFYTIYLTTPYFFDNGKYCIIEIGAYGGGQLLLLNKNKQKWMFQKSIAHWVY